MEIISYKGVENKLIRIRGEDVLLDRDVANIYEIETKRINEAVTRNPDKFPEGYLFELTSQEKNELVANCDRFSKLKHSTTMPKAFSERGLYMLATILKSHKATEATIAIINTFAKLKELNRIITTIQDLPENSTKQHSLMTRTGELMADLILPNDNELTIHETETTLEIGFPFMRLKRTVKKKP